MLDKRTRVHYPKMHMLCSLLSLVAITTIIMRAALMNLSYRCFQTRKIFENTQQESLNTLTCVKFKMSCTVCAMLLKDGDNRSPMPSPEEISAMEELVEILKHFYDATEIL